jgi:hypothetical protein
MPLPGKKSIWDGPTLNASRITKRYNWNFVTAEQERQNKKLEMWGGDGEGGGEVWWETRVGDECSSAFQLMRGYSPAAISGKVATSRPDMVNEFYQFS